jgi:hypothetical protein
MIEPRQSRHSRSPASHAHFPSTLFLPSLVSGGGRRLNRKQDGRRRRVGRAPVDRGGGVHDWGHRDGVAAALIHPHALAPLLHRRARPAVVALPHPPRQSVPLFHPSLPPMLPSLLSLLLEFAAVCWPPTLDLRRKVGKRDVLGTGSPNRARLGFIRLCCSRCLDLSVSVVALWGLWTGVHCPVCGVRA